LAPARRVQRLLAGPFLALLALLGSAAGAPAIGADESLPAPEGRVILTVSGRIDHTNGKGVAEFDRAMLEAMPATTIETLTPWTDGVTRFEGPLARDLMKRVGARGSRLRATALNDYAVDIPIEDFERYPVILAMKVNGEVLRTRDKGPLWIIYPWSDRPELRSEVSYSRSIWQIKELVVRK
jgi:hypothetical protein